jgi:outer membrane murein-binding lipoprotein Lpp
VNANTSSINSLQGQVNTLAAGYMSHSQDIAALRQGVQRGYEGAAVAIANSAPALSRDRKFGIAAKYGTFRGQNALGAMAQIRLSDNVVLNGSIGGGFRYGGIGGGVGGMMEW